MNFEEMSDRIAGIISEVTKSVVTVYTTVP